MVLMLASALICNPSLSSVACPQWYVAAAVAGSPPRRGPGLLLGSPASRSVVADAASTMAARSASPVTWRSSPSGVVLLATSRQNPTASVTILTGAAAGGPAPMG